jgi:hypothetical protein
MNRTSWRVIGVGVIAALWLAAGCAQDVGDIDRTQANKLSKADFDGVWYVRHTVNDVPPNEPFVFVGIASQMEKIRWDIQEDVLIGYRAYQKVPGYDEQAGGKVGGITTPTDAGEMGRDGEYKEEPVVAYPILSHFDVQRQYNPQTGEPTNVIVEDTSDRVWYEREYMRVDWTSNLVNMSIPMLLGQRAGLDFYVQESEQGTDAFYEERGDVDREAEGNELAYFDVTNRLSNGEAEIEVRSSFQRIADYERDYEPAFYDDNMMSKFGYFRTRRFVYDRRKGFTDSGVIYLANRHDIWADDFKRDDQGHYLRDASDRRIPTPMADRTPKPVVYYLSPNFPESLTPSVARMEQDYGRVFKRAVANAKGIGIDEVDTQMFRICPNEITQSTDPACDPRPADDRVDAAGAFVPYQIRPGDLRRNFVYWVHEPQAAGPLGFGPSYPDPETGEIVSGTAYVYGAGVDNLANNALDIVKLVNGDLQLDDAFSGADVRDYILEHLDRDIDPRASMELEVESSLDHIPAGAFRDRFLSDRQRDILSMTRSGDADALEVSPLFRHKKLQQLKDYGFDQLLLDDEMVRALSQEPMEPSAEITSDQMEAVLEANNPFDVDQMLRHEHETLLEASKHNIYMEEFALDAVYGTALSYAGRDDYEVIYQELRNEIFRGVMLHEIGHTVGLRHNFQGSYDAVNYHDTYWDLRRENFEVPRTITDIYEQSSLTAGQRDGEMPRYMYSSIMDYHSRFNSDTAGLGKYDDAAILFAYTFGTYDDIPTSNEDPLPQEPGFVEVFTAVPDRVDLPQFNPFNPRGVIYGYDDRYAPSQHPLENFHYTAVVEMLGGPDGLTQRDTMRYGELRDMQQAGQADRPVEVQYMFCSDEYAEVYVSCSRWDLGADPFEVAKWSIKRYQAYYPFTHFRRDRLNFSSLSGALSVQRTLNRFPNMYQRWLFSNLSDPNLDTSFTLAAFAGLNMLGEILAQPSYGGYVQSGDNYRLATLDKICEEGQQLSDGTPIELCVSPGDGRGRYTRYDYGSGYYYFERATEAGSYWDYVVAMSALTRSVARVIGTNADEEFRSYLVPYYLLFEDNLTTLVNGIFEEDYTQFAPIANGDGEIQRRPLAPLFLNDGQGNSTSIDPLTGASVPGMGNGIPAGSAALDTNVSFSQRFRALLLGVQFFNSNFSQHYVDQMRVFKLGSKEALEPQPGSGFERIAFTDPATGIGYGALRRSSGEGDTLAVDSILRGQDLVAVINDSNASASDRSRAQSRLDALVEDLNIMIDAVELLGNPLL